MSAQQNGGPPGLEEAPEYLIVGHITADVVPGGTTPGGTAFYAARTAARLGLRTAIVTSAPPEYLASLRPEVAGISVHNRPSAAPTTFANIYHEGRRTQFLRGRAETPGPEDIPPAWRASGIVHFGPVADEVDRALLDPALFPHALRGATPQGWLRSWDTTGTVVVARGEAAAALLPGLPVLVFSEEDIERDATVVAACRARSDLVVVTAGAAGSTAYRGPETYHFAAYPTHEVDPTGAGDVFAAAFLARYRATGDVAAAGTYASVAASFIVERPGAEGIPSAEDVARRLAHHEQLRGVRSDR